MHKDASMSERCQSCITAAAAISLPSLLATYANLAWNFQAEAHIRFHVSSAVQCAAAQCLPVDQPKPTQTQVRLALRMVPMGCVERVPRILRHCIPQPMSSAARLAERTVRLACLQMPGALQGRFVPGASLPCRRKGASPMLQGIQGRAHAAVVGADGGVGAQQQAVGVVAG